MLVIGIKAASVEWRDQPDWREWEVRKQTEYTIPTRGKGSRGIR